MSDKILWINRIIALISYAICIFICEKYKLPPVWCFTIAVVYMFVVSFFFEIAREILK